MVGERKYYDQDECRVWPDGTVQWVEDREPYPHMSDDFMVVWAYTEDEARGYAEQRGQQRLNATAKPTSPIKAAWLVVWHDIKALFRRR